MKALIITDGTDSIQSIALLIKNTLTDCKSVICSAQDFTGTEILPTDIFFIGCENPSPKSFAFLEKMLSHINLAPRKCGVFSVNQKSVKYLQTIIKTCEATAIEPFLTQIGLYQTSLVKKADLQKWLKQLPPVAK